MTSTSNRDDDIMRSLERIQAEVDEVAANLKRHPNHPVLYRRLQVLSKELTGLKDQAPRRTVAQLDFIRKALAGFISSQAAPPREEMATLTVQLSEPISPATFAEILSAFVRATSSAGAMAG